MSHEIVRKLRIEDGIVYRASESNNVRPHYFIETVDEYFTTMLREQGQTALDLEILRLYEQGIFQEGYPNQWSTAVKKLRQTSAYAKIDWRKSEYNDECPIHRARKDESFYNSILSKALEFMPNKTLTLFEQAI
jgi:hypothetical protein